MIKELFLSLLHPHALLLLLALYYCMPYFRNPSLISIPSPYPAAFTNLWLLLQARRGRRYLAVDEAHSRLGPVVRIQPNHVSIAHVDAIPIVYGHGTGFTKRSVVVKKGVMPAKYTLADQ